MNLFTERISKTKFHFLFSPFPNYLAANILVIIITWVHSIPLQSLTWFHNSKLTSSQLPTTSTSTAVSLREFETWVNVVSWVEVEGEQQADNVVESGCYIRSFIRREQIHNHITTYNTTQPSLHIHMVCCNACNQEENRTRTKKTVGVVSPKLLRRWLRELTHSLPLLLLPLSSSVEKSPAKTKNSKSGSESSQVWELKGEKTNRSCIKYRENYVEWSGDQHDTIYHSHSRSTNSFRIFFMIKYRLVYFVLLTLFVCLDFCTCWYDVGIGKCSKFSCWAVSR